MPAREKGELGSPYRGNYDGVASKMFTLDALSDSNGIADPNDAVDVTARALLPLIDGFISVVDIYGNVTTPPVLAGIPLVGLVNGVRSTGTTLTAAQIIVQL